MKKRVLPLLLLLTFVFALPALAVEDEETPLPQETLTVETEADEKNIIVNVMLPAATPALTPEIPEFSVVNDPEYAAYSISALDDVPDPGSTLSETITALFGTYTPRTQTVTQQLTDGSIVTYQEVIPGLAGLDWPWLAGVFLFALFFYSLLRMVGGMLK